MLILPKRVPQSSRLPVSLLNIVKATGARTVRATKDGHKSFQISSKR